MPKQARSCASCPVQEGAWRIRPTVNMVLTGGGLSTKAAKLWDVQTGTLLRTFQDPTDNEDMDGVAYSPNGKTVLAVHIFGVSICDTQTGELLHTLQPHGDYLFSLTYSPD